MEEEKRYNMNLNVIRSALFAASAVAVAYYSAPSLNAAGIAASAIMGSISILELVSRKESKKEISDLIKKRDEILSESNIDDISRESNVRGR